MTPSKKTCTFIEHYVLIPQSARFGWPINLIKFQRQFILDVYDDRHVTSHTCLSVARKNWAKREHDRHEAKSQIQKNLAILDLIFAIGGILFFGAYMISPAKRNNVSETELGRPIIAIYQISTDCLCSAIVKPFKHVIN